MNGRWRLLWFQKPGDCQSYMPGWHEVPEGSESGAAESYGVQRTGDANRDVTDHQRKTGAGPAQGYYSTQCSGGYVPGRSTGADTSL